MQLNLPVHSYELRSRPASPARLVNCFPEQMPHGGKTPVLLTRSPGVKAWTTVGTGTIQAMYTAYINFASGAQTYLYVVSGSELYYVDTAGSATLIGNIGSPVNLDIDSNTTSLVVVNEPHVYYWAGTHTGTHTGVSNHATVMTDSGATFPIDTTLPAGSLVGRTISNDTDGSSGVITANTETTVTVAALAGGSGNDWDVDDAYTINTFAQVTDDDFVSRGAGDVEFLDDFLLFREPNSSLFFASDIGSVTEFDSLQVGDTDSAPDNLNGMIADHRQLYLFGTDTSEIWENTGTVGFPFERNINGTLQVGCKDARTVARVYNMILWVAPDNTVRRMDGIVPTRMSTPAIEQKLTNETLVGAFTTEFEGHFFYNLTTSGGTYSLDVGTGEWSERESYGYTNWNPRSRALFNGMELVGDSNSNKIGQLDASTYTDWGGTQRMEWTYQPIYAQGQRAFHDRFEVIMETGVGVTTGQGSDPKMMLQKSDDGGKTWQSLPDKTIGKLGERFSRAVWYNLGSSRQRVYRAAISDPIAVVVTDTVTEVRGGRL